VVEPDPARSIAPAERLRRLIALAMRCWPLLLASSLIAVICASVVLQAVPPRFVARALVLVDGGGDIATQRLIDMARVDSHAEMARSDAVLALVVTGLGLDRDPDFSQSPLPEEPLATEQAISRIVADLRRSVLVHRRGMSHLFAIAVTHRDAVRAALIANTIARLHVARQGGDAGPVRLESPALVPGRPESLDAAVVLVGSAIGGALAGLAIAVGLNRLGGPIRGPSNAGMPVAAIIPEIHGALDRHPADGVADPSSVFARAITGLCDRIETETLGSGPRTIALVSPERGEGRTTVGLAVARCLARYGRRVLLVDADQYAAGLSQALGADDTGDGAVIGADVGRLGHTYLVSDPLSDVTALVMRPLDFEMAHADHDAGGRLGTLVAAARPNVDAIIIDCPPLGSGAEASVATRLANCVLFVVREGRTRAQPARVAHRTIASMVGPHVPVLAVLNRHIDPSSWRERLSAWRSALMAPALRKEAGH
jgi:Mrp family chromosome partitioning ATPase/capsular polysaccharide biosynthesis protein